MKIKSLSLTNYRGFERLELDFHLSVNVIAGINGVGKSSILYALRAMLSRALLSLTVASSQPVPFANDDIAEGKPSLDTLLRFDVHGEAASITVQKARLDEAKRAEWAEALNLLPLQITEAKRAKDRKLTKQLQQDEMNLHDQLNDDGDLHQLLLDQVETEKVRTGNLDEVQRTTQEAFRAFKKQANQPLVIYYSPLRHVFSRVRNLPEGEPLGIAKAFHGTLDEREISFRDFMHWYKWLEHSDNPHTKSRRKMLLETLGQTVTDFIPEFTGLRLEETPRLRFLVTKNGTPYALGQLSDGERGLLALVFDLTRRLALANPELDNPIAEGLAVVLIDELELHLHPSWQRRVLKRLSQTFSGCQFIVTTHSPQVIGQTKPESLRLLRQVDGRVESYPVSQSFGMDSSWVLQEIMGTPARDYEIEQKLLAIYDAVDEDDLSSAKTQIEALEAEVGLFPDLQSVKSLVDRLEMLRNEDEEDN